MTEPLPEVEYQSDLPEGPPAHRGGRHLLGARRAVGPSDRGPCDGLWNLPGGTVRFAEPATDAVHRVALDEIGADVTIDDFLGYIEYPSHTRLGLDWPVGLAFRTHLAPSEGDALAISPDRLDWFTRLPDEMHDEQRAFLRAHGLVD